MNDLSMYVSNVTQFADDTMLDVHAATVDDAVTLLQTEIDKMSVWCARNRLSINISKTCSMLIGTRQRLLWLKNFRVENTGLTIMQPK